MKKHTIKVVYLLYATSGKYDGYVGKTTKPWKKYCDGHIKAAWNKGLNNTPAQNRKISLHMKGTPGTWLGRHLSKQHRKRISLGVKRCLRKGTKR